MLAKVKSCAVIGLSSELVEVEVDITLGFPMFAIVGLPDTAIQEARERVKSAIKNSGVNFPSDRRLVINLAPADIKKEGPAYDLPMALGIILAEEGLAFDASDCLLVGELSLEGKLRHTNGILPVAIYARERGIKTLYVPEVNATEASLIEGLEIIPVASLRQFIRHLSGEEKIQPFVAKALPPVEIAEFESDMAFVKGQEHVKRALEIAAAGAHNLLMSGPPGSGKTLLARTLPSILPRMSKEEILETTKIYSVAGLLPHNEPLINRRPFRSPHHSASGVALVGGGKYPKPGEISLAHRGVLFLDEFPEFPKQVLENLRQPLEDGIVTISRAQGTLSFPARFTLIASQNPCPCGYYGDMERPCTCSPNQINNYQRKVSGPILDRIDLHIEVPRVKFEKMNSETMAEPSAKIRERVEAARLIQEERFKNIQTKNKIRTNSEMRPQEIKEFCKIDNQTVELLRNAVNQLHLSARAYHRILKLARTIADLSQSENILLAHVAEALQYRPKII
jgi:magnesium chelatase family protein